MGNEQTLTTCLVQNLEKGEIKKITKSTSKKIQFCREVGNGSFFTDVLISLSKSSSEDFNNSNVEYIAIEVKISDWKQGLYQAWKYSRFAERSYLAIYSKYAHRIKLAEFEKYNIGVISFDEDDVKILFKPKVNRHSNKSHAIKLREEIWQQSLLAA